MITTPTTFVIGAGASKDYGLPISSDLRKEAHGLLPQHSVYQLIHEAGLCTPDKLNQILDDLRNQGTPSILDDLRNQGTPSIDEFLFTRQPDKRCCMDRGGDGIRPFPSGSVRRYARTQAVRVRSLCSGLFGRVGSP